MYQHMGASTDSGASFTTSGFASTASTTPERQAESQSISGKPLTQTYTDDADHFELKYPSGLTANSFATPDGNGTVVLVADLKTGLGMQVLVTPYTGPENVTADLIKQQVPDITIVQPQQIAISSSGTSGTAFVDGSGSDAHRQIWFAYNGNLYQITAPLDFDPTLRDIMNTWKFK